MAIYLNNDQNLKCILNGVVYHIRLTAPAPDNHIILATSDGRTLLEANELFLAAKEDE